MRLRILTTICVALALGGCAAAAAFGAAAERFDASKLPAAAARKIDFIKEVQPLLSTHCYACHGPAKQKADLRFDAKASPFKEGAHGTVIKPGDGAGSLLVRAVSGLDPKLQMPAEGERLTAEQVSILRAWIDQGAQWPDSASAAIATENRLDHWSFKPVVRHESPSVNDARWARNPIDAFVLAKLEFNQLKPSPEADRRTLIRRLSFDLIGLPPTADEIDAFVVDTSSDAYEKLVDRLLASPRYGERWARHWLDVVRFADSYGFERNSLRPNAWRYRDYVIRSLNDDKPYDQFLREQLAGDQVGAEEGTGFIVGGPSDQVKGKDPALNAQQRADDLHDMVATTGSAFLGLTVGCARCHDHKFDPISHVDYYQMTAMFAGVEHAERPVKSGATQEENDRVVREAQARLEEIESALLAYEPVADPDARLSLVEESRTTVLTKSLPRATYGGGSDRGRNDDPGSATTLPNLGAGFYAWKKVANTDVFAWKPAVHGRYRVWLSWANGRSGHAGDVTYHLDADGDIKTTDDRKQIAMVDQRRFAGGGGGVAVAALWSGFLDAGVHDLTPASQVILRGGSMPNSTVTSDAMLLEAVPDGASLAPARPFPPLRAGIRPTGNVDRFKPVEARFVRFTSLQTNQGTAQLDELEVLSAGLTPRRVALAKPGELLDDTVVVELPQLATIERVRWGGERKPTQTTGVPVRYRLEVSTSAGGPWTLVATEGDRLPFSPDKPAEPIRTVPVGASPESAQHLNDLLNELVWLNDRLKSVRGPAVAYAGKFVEPKPTFRLHRGEPLQPREQVNPGALSSIGSKLVLPADAPEQLRRVKLAEWVTDASNPLPARVIVNRLWHYHFGQGIVNTPSDFGRMGAKPSHPELLDWLASELTTNGWKLKRLHRLMVTSATYRQASDWREACAKVDGTTALLWRHPPTRLDAESLRDSILAVSGKLNLAMGGPGFSPFKPDGNFVRVYEAREDFGPVEWRRMIYQTKPRIHQDGTFGAFDCPDGAQIAPKRTNSTTPLQALNLLNSPFMLQQSQFLAERVERESADGGRVRTLFRLTLGRAPTGDEQSQSEAFLREHGTAALCRVMLNSNEFLYVY